MQRDLQDPLTRAHWQQYGAKGGMKAVGTRAAFSTSKRGLPLRGESRFGPTEEALPQEVW